MTEHSHSPSIYREYQDLQNKRYAAASHSLAPQVSDREVAYDLAHELQDALEDADERYRRNLGTEALATVDGDPLEYIEETHKQKAEDLSRALTKTEFTHRKRVPEDFEGGERHYKAVPIDPEMRRRMQAHSDMAVLQRLERDLHGDDPSTTGLTARKKDQ